MCFFFFFFPVGYITAFLCKGTPNNAIVFCLGAVLNSEINKKHQNVKTTVSQRMLFMVSELNQEGSASPCQLGTCGQDSKFFFFFLGLKICIALYESTDDCNCDKSVDFEIYK